MFRMTTNIVSNHARCLMFYNKGHLVLVKNHESNFNEAIILKMYRYVWFIIHVCARLLYMNTHMLSIWPFDIRIEFKS